MEKNVWLYFNTEVNDDNVSATSNCCFPAKNLVGMTPTGNSVTTLQFKSMKNVTAAATDTVALNLGTANTHLDVMKTITRAINNTRPTFDGFVTVADDLTTIVGGAAGTATTEYLSGQEAGKIATCGAIDVAVASNSAVVATSDGAGTGTVPGGGFWNVSSTNDAHIVILPAATLGTVVYLNSDAEQAQDYELRTSDPANIYLNNVKGANKESVILHEMSLVIATCVLGGAAGKWIVTETAKVGATDVHTVPVAD